MASFAFLARASRGCGECLEPAIAIEAASAAAPRSNAQIGLGAVIQPN